MQSQRFLVVFCLFILTLGCAHWKSVSSTSISPKLSEKVYELQFDPTGNYVLGVTHSGDVWVWNLQTLKESGKPKALPAFEDAFAYEHSYPQKRRPVSAVWSHDGNYIATASLGGTGKLWQTQTGMLINSLPGEAQASYSALLSLDQRENIPYAIAFDPKDQWVAIGDDEGHVRFWEVAHQKFLYSLSTEQGSIHHIFWSSEGDFFVTAGTESTVKMWEMKTEGPQVLSAWQTESVKILALSTNGLWLAVETQRSEVHIWNRLTHKEHTVPSSSSVTPRFLAFSPTHASHLLVATLGEQAFLWDAQSQHKVFTFPEKRPALVSFSPEGSYLALAEQAGTIHLRQALTGHPLITLGKYKYPPLTWAFHPLGSKMMAVWPNGMTQFWDFTQPLP